jgi:hypothetical protein
MVFMEQQRMSKFLPTVFENIRMTGIDALSRSTGNHHHLTPVAAATTDATRMPGAVSYHSGQYHYPAKESGFCGYLLVMRQPKRRQRY